MKNWNDDLINFTFIEISLVLIKFYLDFWSINPENESIFTWNVHFDKFQIILQSSTDY